MDRNLADLRNTTLSPTSDDKAFWVCRGDRIANIYDLANCIESLSPDEFTHHVSLAGKRNDFAIWVQDVLNNPLLARDMMLDDNLRDQAHLVTTIRDHVAWLEHA